MQLPHAAAHFHRLDIGISRNQQKSEPRLPELRAALHRIGPLQQGQQVLYVTERAVFELTPQGLSLVEVAPGVDVAVTVSIGGAYAPQWVRSTPALWKERADQQLYRAKAEGRNRACLEQPPVSLVSAEEKGMLFGTSQFQDFDE